MEHVVQTKSNGVWSLYFQPFYIRIGGAFISAIFYDSVNRIWGHQGNRFCTNQRIPVCNSSACESVKWATVLTCCNKTHDSIYTHVDWAHTCRVWLSHTSACSPGIALTTICDRLFTNTTTPTESSNGATSNQNNLLQLPFSASSKFHCFVCKLIAIRKRPKDNRRQTNNDEKHIFHAKKIKFLCEKNVFEF